MICTLRPVTPLQWLRAVSLPGTTQQQQSFDFAGPCFPRTSSLRITGLSFSAGWQPILFPEQIDRSCRSCHANVVKLVSNYLALPSLGSQPITLGCQSAAE